ncbi:hypothetical protein [Geodermatophilus sp. URMC 63]
MEPVGACGGGVDRGGGGAADRADVLTRARTRHLPERIRTVTGRLTVAGCLTAVDPDLAGELGAAPTAPPSAPGTIAPEPAPETDWEAVLTGLYDRRAEAFTTGSAPALEEVYAPDSPLLAADRTYLEDLTAAGEVLRGFRPAVVEVGVTAGPTEDGRVTVRLVDDWPDYAVAAAADPDGPARRTEAGRGEVAVAVTLVRTSAGWRIESAGRLA